MKNIQSANAILLSVLNSIITHLQFVKDDLHKRMEDLDLAHCVAHVSRATNTAHLDPSFSSDPEDLSDPFDSLDPSYSRSGKSSYILQPIQEVPAKYATFMHWVVEAYEQFIEKASGGMETICQVLLSHCQPISGPTGASQASVSGCGSKSVEDAGERCELHKTLFLKHVLADPAIQARLRVSHGIDSSSERQTRGNRPTDSLALSRAGQQR
jgi:hypothetical protein